MKAINILQNEQENKKRLGKQARKAAFAAILGVCLMFLFQIIASFGFAIATRIFPILSSGIYSKCAEIVMYVFYIALPFLIAKLILNFINKPADFIVKRPSVKKPIFFIFGAIGIGYFVNMVMNLLFAPFMEDFSADLGIQAETPIEVILCFVLYAVLPAILEEWAFRGVLLKNLLPFGKWGAIIISSVLFGIAHVDPPRIIFASIFGALLAICYEHTRSLRIPIIIHFLNNSISVAGTLAPIESPFALVLSLIIFAIMGVGIGAAIYYCKKGVKKQIVSLNKPYSIGQKLTAGEFVTKAVLNYGMLFLIPLYAFFFYLYFFAVNI